MDESIDAAIALLRAQFPDVPCDVVTSVFTDSFIVVVDAAGEPLVDKAEELARIRLELRTRHPALPVPQPRRSTP